MISCSNQLTHCNSHQILNSCIQVAEVKINRRLSVPCQINFQLNTEILEQIEQIKAKNWQLKLYKSKLAALRYYALLNLPLETKVTSVKGRQLFSSASWEGCNQHWCSQSQLNFTTNYIFPVNQHLAVVRSLIDLKGQISQQIHQDLWHSPRLLERVVNVHHWLIGQILIQLPLKTPSPILRLLKVLLLLLGIIAAICLWYFLPFNNLLKILIISCTFYLTKKYLIKVIKQQIKNWFTKAIIAVFLAKTTRKRQIAINILSLLV